MRLWVAREKMPKGNSLSLSKDGLQVNKNAANPKAQPGCGKRIPVVNLRENGYGHIERQRRKERG
jgi:hypothetical protein